MTIEKRAEPNIQGMSKIAETEDEKALQDATEKESEENDDENET